MNELVTNLKKLQSETLENLKNSKSENTLRAYKADIADFFSFCNKHNLKFLPTDPNIVSLYLTHLSKTHKFSSLKRRLASISMFHKTKGHYIDIKHPIISENILGIKRVKGSIQKGKKPILINDLKLIVQAINEDNINEFEKLKNKSLILLGFSGGFRRSELVSLLVEDFDFVPEGVKILVRKSKTDQSGEGLVKGIPYFKYKDLCSVSFAKELIDKLNIKQGKLFDICDKGVALKLKKYATLAGLDGSKYAGHSLRSGFATSTAEAGAEERNIMAMTGHKSTQMVRRYIKEANLFKNNALNKLEIK
jgi:site-specific recombinase XerD